MTLLVTSRRVLLLPEIWQRFYFIFNLLTLFLGRNFPVRPDWEFVIHGKFDSEVYLMKSTVVASVLLRCLLYLELVMIRCVTRMVCVLLFFSLTSLYYLCCLLDTVH